MRRILFVAFFALFLSAPAMAKRTHGNGHKALAPSQSSNGSGLQTEMSFDGSNVNGRYHTATEAIATVESEKILKEVLAPRRDFRDRVEESLRE